MSMLDIIRDGFKYLDKNGLKHLVEKIKAHDVHWTGTHAEYEVQKDTIPAYAILHFTDDYDENVQVGVYSTEETKTGEIWIDNKPIYRKVITGSNIPANGHKDIPNVGFGINIIENIVSAKGYFYNTAWIHLINGPYSAVYYAPASDRLYLNNPTGFAVTRYAVILEYTKTTD